MIPAEYYERYAELNPVQRDQRIDRLSHGSLTPTDIYLRLKRIDTQMEPLVHEANDLLKIAIAYFDRLDRK
jgi:hypothetical protein